MSDSQAIALLADPTKVDISSPPAIESGTNERPIETALASTPAPPSTPKADNVLDLLEETQEKPFTSSEPKIPPSSAPGPSATPNAPVFDLNDVEVKDEIVEAPPQLTPEQIREKKERILYDIERLRRRGVRFPRSFTMASDLDEMQSEYNRIKKDLETEQAVRFQRKMLMTCVSGIEMLNNRFDPFDIQLDGWSEQVNENVGDYDEVFEELYEKYKGSGKMAPELRLLFMLGGSALMFHMTKSMFSSATPQVADILRSNPGLAQQMSQAAASQMGGGGLAGMMNMARGGGGAGSGVTASASAAPPSPPPRGIVIPPPENVDDVLNSLQGGSSKPAKRTKSRKPKSSAGGIDTLSLSLNN